MPTGPSVALHAYLDDSGTHEDSPVCIIAGYFASEAKWIRFDKEWRQVLNRAGLEEFHANRFWAHAKGRQIPEYKGWTNEQDNRFIGDLLSILENSPRIYPVSCCVLRSEWDALAKEERAYLTGGTRKEDGAPVRPGAPNKPYFLPFLVVIRTVARYCNWGHLVHFSFDQNKHFSGYALEYFKEIKQLEVIDDFGKLGEIFFPDSRSATPLQAADLLAYEIYLYIQSKLGETDGKLLYRPKVLARTLRNIRNLRDSPMFDRKGFDLMLENFRARSAEKRENCP